MSYLSLTPSVYYVKSCVHEVSNLVSLIVRSEVVNSAALSPNMMPSFSHVTLGLGRASMSTWNSRTSFSLAVSTGSNIGASDTNSVSADIGI